MYFIKKLSVFLAAIVFTLILAIPVLAGNYTVVKNDSIYAISQLFNTSTSKIKTDNNLSSNIIYPGQVLKVPTVDYTVKRGDTLCHIAKSAGISLSTLRKINNKLDDSIYIGQKLILPVTNGEGTKIKASKPVVSYSSDELDLLARLINAEAASESYQAMVAVGAVVVNRVQDSRFPNTISEVINQNDGRNYQFTPVKNGAIKKLATSSSKEAALEALNGADPTNGALYYYDNSSKRSRYARSLLH